MVEQGFPVNQYIVVERPDSQGEMREIWKGESADFKRRKRYLKTAEVSVVLEKDGVLVRKLSLNVSRRFGQGLQPA